MQAVPACLCKCSRVAYCTKPATHDGFERTVSFHSALLVCLHMVRKELLLFLACTADPKQVLRLIRSLKISALTALKQRNSSINTRFDYTFGKTQKKRAVWHSTVSRNTTTHVRGQTATPSACMKICKAKRLVQHLGAQSGTTPGCGAAA